jgi:hypothetical protein
VRGEGGEKMRGGRRGDERGREEMTGEGFKGREGRMEDEGGWRRREEGEGI